MDWKVPLADLDYGVEEERAVLNVLHSKWLTMGEVTQQFEAEFSQLVGRKYAFAVSNATEALHLAVTALGIGEGDEVITPSFSFVATSNAVLYTAADVIFADIIGNDDLTIDPLDIERKITRHTKAIIVMHYGGYPCRMEEILAVAAQHRLPVIEDAAHCPGATLKRKALGSWGTIGCFSFFSNKNLSTGEGGMIVTDDEFLAEKIRMRRSHGMTTLTYDRHQGHAYSYDVIDLGYNYRIDEIRSALGREQLKKLMINNNLRKRHTEQYWSLLDKVNVDLPFREYEGEPAYHLLPVLLPEGTNRKKVIDCMRAQLIQTSIHYPPTHSFTFYTKRYGRISLPKTELAAERELTLPLYPTMSSSDVELVVDSLVKSLETALKP